jgi:GTP-binding protein
MFNQATFIKSAFKLNEIPQQRFPEIILCGRSNVGKSSFINSIFNRKDLAKVSSTPGKTRSINFYLIDRKFYLIDLPGYGYAKSSKFDREKWASLINEFLLKSNSIKLAIHFIDSRHRPTPLDLALNNFLRENNIPYIILLSKIDKLNQSQLSDSKKKLNETFPDVDLETNVVLFSAIKNFGKEKIITLFKDMFY